MTAHVFCISLVLMVATLSPCWAQSGIPADTGPEGLSAQLDAPVDPKLEERRMQVLLNAEQLVQRFEESQKSVLQLNRKAIAKMLQEYQAFSREPRLLLPELLLLNARSLPATSGGRETSSAWTNAILAEANLGQRAELLFEAATEVGMRGDRSSARSFLVQAKALVEAGRGQSDLLDIEFKVRELLVTGGSRDWREVEDEISDMRALTAKFPVWSPEKLETLILEGNLRLDAQPEENNKEARIRSIRSEMRLSYEAQEADGVPQALKDRYRALMRRIDDIYAFDARDPEFDTR